MSASEGMHVDVLGLLVDRGAKVNAADEVNYYYVININVLLFENFDFFQFLKVSSFI